MKYVSTAILALGITLAAPIYAQTAPTTEPAAVVIPDQVQQILTKLDELSAAMKQKNQELLEKSPELAMKEFKAFMQEYINVSADLVNYDLAVPKFGMALTTRWSFLGSLDAQNKSTNLDKETAQYLVRYPAGKVSDSARYHQAALKLPVCKTQEEREAVISDFKAAVKEPNAVATLLMVAMKYAADPLEKGQYRDDIVTNYPKTNAGRRVKVQTREKEFAGKPFEQLEFKDAISGNDVSMKALKGKVVVVDFWATWCGPCKADMPEMKKIYSEFKDKGVEFIGVSLDHEQGGLELLRAYVKDNKITWPQYFAGKDRITARWNVPLIPTVFVINQEGIIVTTEGHGRLEKLLPELLKKKTQTTAVN